MSSEQEPIRLRFTVTPDDVIDGTRAYAGYNSRSGLTAGALLIVVGIAGTLLADNWAWLVLAFGGLVVIASRFSRSLDRAAVRANSQTGVGLNCEMEFTDAGLRYHQGGVEGLIRWSAVTEVREGEAAILLLRNRTILANIPKRAFRSPQELEAARSLLGAAASGQG